MALRDPIRDVRRLATGWRWRGEHVLGTRIPAHYDAELTALIKRVRRQTLTGAARIAALVDATEYVVDAGIEGDFAECGVWKGGSMMAVALTLIRRGETARDLYLYDTYTGMPEPGEQDVDSAYDGYSLERRWKRKADSGWAAVPAAAVRENLLSTGYPAERIHIVEGMVEDTLPGTAPDRLALLRLDTDWYASTKHELAHLYPRLSDRGVLIIDDYGHYEGARRAVDEYLAETGERLLLNRIDYTGRVALKPG
jgi:O-methyltransferase